MDSMDKDEFLVDKTTVDDSEESAAPTPASTYATVFDAAQSATNRRPKQACWNCGGEGHAVAACKERRDPARIRRARAQFDQDRRPARFSSADRYTSGGNGPQANGDARAGRFAPGNVSVQLERALGIDTRRGDIPEYIKRMRSMGMVDGYPPGYLKAAITGDDHISFHTHNFDDALRTEDGEVIQGVNVPVVDQSKMIQFSFFNCPSRSYDDRRWHAYPRWPEFVAMHNAALEREHRRRLESVDKHDSEPMQLASSESLTVTLSSSGSDRDERTVVEGRGKRAAAEEGECILLDDDDDGDDGGQTDRVQSAAEGEGQAPPAAKAPPTSHSPVPTIATAAAGDSAPAGGIKHSAAATCTPVCTPLATPTLDQLAVGVVPFEVSHVTPVKGPGFSKIRRLLTKHRETRAQQEIKQGEGRAEGAGRSERKESGKRRPAGRQFDKSSPFTPKHRRR